MVTCATHSGRDTDFNELGLAYGHAYTVLGTAVADDQKLYKMRNPWGRGEAYKGDWSDSSALWTEELKKQVGFEENDDGIWYISAEDYHKNFGITTVNTDVSKEHLSYYA